jgi:hypothetical protein
MPQASTPHPGGTRSSHGSTPKVVRVNADDSNAVLYRNLGNGRRLPFMWGTTVTLASGTTSITVSSGVSFNDHDVSAGIIEISPLSAAGAALDYYVNKNTSTNEVTLNVVAAANNDDCDFDVMIMLGVGYDFLSSHTNQIWKRMHT